MNIFSINSYFLNLHAIPLLIIGLLILSSGLFVFIRLKDKLTASTFLAMSISGSVWFLCTMMGYLSKYPETGLLWFKIDNVGVVFLSSTVYAFVSSFLGLFKERKPFISIAYIGSTILAILTLTTNWMDAGVHTYFWGFFPIWGTLSLVFLPFFYAYMLLSFLELIFYLQHGKSRAIKNQIIYFILAFGFAYTSSIDYFATFGIPVYPMSFISMGVYFIIIAFAITKARLMDISVIISKSIAYGITIIFLAAIYLSFVLYYLQFISHNIDPRFVLIGLAYGTVCCFIFEKIRIFIQTSSDKLFLQGRFDLAKTSSDVAERLSSIVSLEALSSALESIRVNDIESSLLELHLLEEYPSNEGVNNNIALSSNDPLKEYFSANRIIAAASRLPKQLKETLQKNVEYIAPSYSSDKLIALLFIGRKLSENPYSSDEIAVFKVLAPQIATVIERIKPYEKIKHDFDSTQKKLFETEKMLGRSARLASLGTLTAGVTHEIRNPLAVIRTETELLPKEERNKAYLFEFKNLIIRHVERIANIIDKMLYLARSKEAIAKQIDINKLIEQYVVGIVSSKNVDISTQLSPVPNVLAIEDDLHQVLINLTNNAIKAMSDGGNLTIKTYETKEKGSNRVVIEIIDTGIGITQENLEKIFDPFFSTWENGTGLGLSISYKIIEELKGRIEVQSQVGKGSAFKIILPAV